ncbi:plasminogen activator inhibitor 1 RNA-binding protein isoform X1 [Drosophila miranda]|uniref:plasminogen activator inhibitor 1 RNA-binding protein isoform X1 n=1 Tax=Drosophila miranda TaxID=7229 RepID=UPI0007E76A2E|nr:plasminogen activator inhibitor 1 RNA-binding protein isoform X1 [Drosophila miranda]XP_017143770.1 plasminogen activator inhibitor 1 RNA-binding protein isoform X1 [Drosophila miranda]
MDNSGYNRYELLSTYDEDVATAISIKMNVGLSNKKQIKKTVLNKPEKENKPMTGKHNNLGKTEKIVKRVVGNVTKKENKGLSDAKNIVHIRSNENNRFGGVDFGNDIPQRQFKDRDNRGQQRFGNGEKYGKREFDRQSGSGKTGIKTVDNREGAGAHNRGSPKQDIEDIKTGDLPLLEDKDDSGTEQLADPVNTLEADESKQMTLDEWKALRDKRVKPNFNLRKAGEGVDNSEWKNMIILSKKREINSEDNFEYDPSMYPQRVGRLQHVVDIQYNFNDARRVGFRGPQRGASRPVSASGNGFEMVGTNKVEEKRRPGQKPLKVDDEIQFPNLS